MYLENLVFDAVDPQQLGRFWEAVVDGERLTDDVEGFETRLSIPNGPELDLCFQRVPEAPSEPLRLHVDVREGSSRAAAVGTGPIAALRLESADPDRDAEFWSWLTGWTAADPAVPRSLRHPSRLGPVLELCPEKAPKGAAKNRLHLDVRLEAGEDPDAVAVAIAEHGGREFVPSWADQVPWRMYQDPSGNEFCALPAHAPS
jgi:Glyoxalase-like domain